ncbi:hypothetical protein BKA70DRAFT_1192674 [Coprinopsis sp. MPI-PUGE-AT-0042]|nr:hypothetical protein BKA70DRAFT_1192674 [Coprinopsis sp. MPI-PUGE-AT-0042]
MPTHSRLFDIPVEIFPVIAEHIPLCSAPQTLLSFALTSRTSHNILIPILFSHLILRSEQDALSVLQGILGNPSKGSLVRGIYIHSPLSSEIRAATGDGTGDVVDVVRTLERVIKSGFVPLLHTLELHLDGHSWWSDNDGDLFHGFGELRASFWEALETSCPCLRSLAISNIGDSSENRWINKSGLFEIQGLHALSLRFAPGNVEQEGNALLLKSVKNLALHLRCLNLAPNSTSDEWIDLGPYWDLDFPHIHSLTLSGQVSHDTSKAMSFWQRHPSLEYINLSFCAGAPMFSDNIDTIEGFLPKLRHLTAPYADIRRLTPLLPGLVSMSVHNTVNAQVPYLLRSVLSGGLPNLRSLNVEQSPEPEGSLKRIEAVRWYESLDGEFCVLPQGRRPKIKITDQGWITSIARGAPNLQELALSTYQVHWRDFQGGFASQLSTLRQLERFFFRGMIRSLAHFDEDPEARDEFMSVAKSLAVQCPSLEEVGDSSPDVHHSGFVTAKMVQATDGGILEVKVGIGHGMVIGQECQAFPKIREGSF